MTSSICPGCLVFRIQMQPVPRRLCGERTELPAEFISMQGRTLHQYHSPEPFPGARAPLQVEAHRSSSSSPALSGERSLAAIQEELSILLPPARTATQCHKSESGSFPCLSINDHRLMLVSAGIYSPLKLELELKPNLDQENFSNYKKINKMRVLRLWATCHLCRCKAHKAEQPARPRELLVPSRERPKEAMLS